MARSRTEQRRGIFTADQRIELVENDLDDNDNQVAELTKAVKRLTGVLVGAIISFASSAVAMAFTIATRR